MERLGIARALEALNKADLALVVVDATVGMSREDAEILENLPTRTKPILITNKIDLLGIGPQYSGGISWWKYNVSARTGQGMDLLRTEILSALGWDPAEEGVFLARQRHLDALDRAARHLSDAVGSARQLEIFAEELRSAQAALSEITGEFSADDLLGEIFGRFCIGK